jgi:Na+-transporting NADH:ubiquinone oxidoreductase subunit NqrB
MRATLAPLRARRFFRPKFAAPDWTDARWYQLGGQAAILSIGLILREFEISLLQVAAIAVAALATQWAGSLLNAVRFEWKSAAITTLSLSLLLRSDALWPLMLAAVIAIGSKFLFRLRGRHLFNPANIAIVAMLTFFGESAWTTHGAWADAFWFALFIAAAGAFICRKAARIDVPIVFLGATAALLFGRALYLGDPMGIPLLRLQNGELILFAFFMLTDPKTTPDRLETRVAFTLAAAVLAYVLQYHYFITDGLFYAAFGLAFVRPLMELVRPGAAYQWGARGPNPAAAE